MVKNNSKSSKRSTKNSVNVSTKSSVNISKSSTKKSSKKTLKDVKLSTWIMLALLLTSMILAGYFRAYPAFLPAANNWATNSVDSYYKNQIGTQVNAQYPNLPSQNKDIMINNQYAKFKLENAGMLQNQVDQTAKQFKDRMKNDNGETYLLAIDPYFYLSFAENILDHGYQGDIIKDGKPYDTLRVAPIGSDVPKQWHSNLMIITWKILKVFRSNISLMGAVFWLPLILSILAIIPAFFLVKRRYGTFGGFIGASIIAVNGAFLSRTPAGFSDTDAYNVLFPLLVAWLFLEAFLTKDLKKKLAYATGAGLFLGLYSMFWSSGWWYIYDILLGVIIAYLGYLLLRYFFTKQRKSLFKSVEWPTIKNTLLLALVFITATGILITIFWGFIRFLKAPFGAITFTQLKNAVTTQLWPNVLTTVAELNEVNFQGVVTSIGGKFLYTIALLGIIVTMLPKKLKDKELGFFAAGFVWVLYLVSEPALSSNFLFKILTSLGAPASGTVNSLSYLFLLGLPVLIGSLLFLRSEEELDLKYAFLITIWMIGTLYATTKGVRFTLMLVPPIGIAIGSFAGFLYDWLSKWLSEELELSINFMKIGIGILLALMILVAPIKAAHGIALGEVPSMNDAWYNSLTKIQNEAAPDAIITSWWDFGHWFKNLGKRGVSFDGGSQGSPVAHWVGKLLLTGDQDESLGILRMIDCGSFEGYDKLLESIGDPIDTKILLDKILLMNKEDAKTKLIESGVENPDEILELTHCEAPEAYLITSEDMVGKAGVWGHFGSWDFERAYIASVLRKESQTDAVNEMINRFDYDKATALTTYSELRSYVDERKINNWVSPWPGYITQRWVGCQDQIIKVNQSTMVEGASKELVDKNLVICPANIHIGQEKTTDIFVEAAIIDPETPELSRIRYAFYQNGKKVGQNDGVLPSKLLFAHTNVTDGAEIFDLGPKENIGVVFDEEHNRMLLTDQLHVDSLFARLFYLNGKYDEDHFEMFSDQIGVNGQRIIVWKVKWQ